MIAKTKMTTCGMENTLVGFSDYCESYGIKLTEAQISIARTLFKTPRAGGKTLLIALLYAYDPSAEKVSNNLRLRLDLHSNIH